MTHLPTRCSSEPKSGDFEGHCALFTRSRLIADSHSTSHRIRRAGPRSNKNKKSASVTFVYTFFSSHFFSRHAAMRCDAISPFAGDPNKWRPRSVAARGEWRRPPLVTNKGTALTTTVDGPYCWLPWHTMIRVCHASWTSYSALQSYVQRDA